MKENFRIFNTLLNDNKNKAGDLVSPSIYSGTRLDVAY